MRSLYAVPFFLLTSTAAGQVVNTVQNGLWTDPATWSCGCVPGSSQSLVIVHNVEVLGSLTLDQPQVQVTSTGTINMSLPDQVNISTVLIVEGHVFFQASVAIFGLVDVTGFFEAVGVVTNSGQITMDGGMMIIEGDLLNYQSISGDGSICVHLITNNVGAISGTVDLCDLSPTTTVAPIVDMNSGTIMGTVTYCTNSVCSTMGLADVRSGQHLTVSPNPAGEHTTIGPLAHGVARGVLVALDGRVLEAELTNYGNDVRIANPGTDGQYMLLLFDATGHMIGKARVTFQR